MSEKSPENYRDDPISVRKMGHNDPIWTKFELDVSFTLVDHNPKFQIDISKHGRKKSGKPEQTDGQTDRRTDRQTDRQTDGHRHTIIRPVFQTGV